jgi:hypothetical protein
MTELIFKKVYANQNEWEKGRNVQHRYSHQSSYSQGLKWGEIFFLLDDGMKRKV